MHLYKYIDGISGLRSPTLLLLRRLLLCSLSGRLAELGRGAGLESIVEAEDLQVADSSPLAPLVSNVWHTLPAHLRCVHCRQKQVETLKARGLREDEDDYGRTVVKKVVAQNSWVQQEDVAILSAGGGSSISMKLRGNKVTLFDGKVNGERMDQKQPPWLLRLRLMANEVTGKFCLRIPHTQRKEQDMARRIISVICVLQHSYACCEAVRATAGTSVLLAAHRLRWPHSPPRCRNASACCSYVYCVKSLACI